MTHRIDAENAKLRRVQRVILNCDSDGLVRGQSDQQVAHQSSLHRFDQQQIGTGGESYEE